MMLHYLAKFENAELPRNCTLPSQKKCFMWNLTKITNTHMPQEYITVKFSCNICRGRQNADNATTFKVTSNFVKLMEQTTS